MDGEIPERGALAVNTAEEMCIKLSGCSYSANMSDGTAVNGTRRGYVPGGTIWANGLGFLRRVKGPAGAGGGQLQAAEQQEGKPRALMGLTPPHK